MSVTRNLKVRRLLVLCAAMALAVAQAPPVSAANVAPRIVAARMADVDKDDRADRVVLTYSEAVTHARDADGSYPFAVGGYTVASVGAAAKVRTLVVFLREKSSRDISARPAITYTRSRVDRVLDGAGLQAATQTFDKTVALDRDADGYAAKDCAPTNSAIHPGAADRPDLRFVDSNCDRIDGDKKLAVFVSPAGDDANPGTMSAPKRTLLWALEQVLSTAAKDDIYLAGGTYEVSDPLALYDDGLGLYGGYSGDAWTRSLTTVTKLPVPKGGGWIYGSDTTLQLLTIEAADGGPAQNSTALTVQNSTNVRLQSVVLRAGNAGSGPAGSSGLTGDAGGVGGLGGSGSCDGAGWGSGGAAGSGRGVASATGGAGGRGGSEGANSGSAGSASAAGVAGGAGGSGGTTGGDGFAGSTGSAGAAGSHGTGGGPNYGSGGYSGNGGTAGAAGQSGTGGGGGGGGGGQGGTFVNDGAGNGGGGGGGGGRGGAGGQGGGPGGASIALYLWGSQVTVTGGSQFVSGYGGYGGSGGTRGAGGYGGAGGQGGSDCPAEVGIGGNGGSGGRGGDGGHGGGGAGGPSIGIVAASDSTVSVNPASTFTQAGGGSGGSSPAGPGSAGTTGATAQVLSLTSS